MTKKRRLSASDWVALGLDALSRNGPDAVKLEAVCKAANLTKGSFYHHFADHAAFLSAMVARWSKEQTDDIAQMLEDGGSAEENAASLTEAALHIDYRLELGIRELARRSVEIARAVEETDAKRLRILSEIYTARFKLGARDADNLALLEYAAFCGVFLLKPDLPLAEQRALAARYEQLMRKALA